MGALMGFMLAIKLTRQIKAGEISIKDLPYTLLRESDAANIMSVHGHLYQQLPRHLKTPKVLRKAILSRPDAVRTVGCNISDELACLAIDKWGRSAFMVLSDRNKTPAVALHAIRNMAMAYKDIKKEKRTHEMSALAFDLNNGLIHDIPDEHLTTHMLIACAKANISPMRGSWPTDVFTQEAADAIAKHMPEQYNLIPDRLTSPEVLAVCACKQISLISFSENALKAVIAIRYSMEHLAKNTLMTQELLDWSKGSVDRDQCLQDFISGRDRLAPASKPVVIPSGFQHLVTPSALQNLQSQQDASNVEKKKNRLGLYAFLYEMHADDPALLADQDWNQDLLPDLVAKLHGARVALKYFPKARQRGRWLEEDLGL